MALKKTLIRLIGDDSEDEPDTAFRFMELPPELRNEIYRLSLKACSEIRVSRHINKSNQGPRWLRNGNRVGHILKGITMVGSKGRSRKRPINEVLTTSILRVSKSIQKEAAPILYGANKFTFESTCALTVFKLRIRSNFGLLRDIHIKSVKSVSTMDRERLKYCLPCLKLGTRILIGGFLDTGVYLSIERVSDLLWDMLKAFVMQPWEWSQDRSGGGGSYKMVGTPDEEEQKQRVNMLRFIERPRVTFRLRDRAVVQASQQNEFHELIKNAILERLEQTRLENQARSDKLGQLGVSE